MAFESTNAIVDPPSRRRTQNVSLHPTSVNRRIRLQNRTEASKRWAYKEIHHVIACCDGCYFSCTAPNRVDTVIKEKFMPNRIIRDEILTSERYWSVGIEAQQLFFHLLLLADDTARYTASTFSLRARCFAGRPTTPKRIEKLLAELIREDLIRPYDAEGKRFIFIPRFRQRLRYENSRFPEPPNEINDLPNKRTDLGLTSVGLKPVSRQTPACRSEAKGREGIHTSALRFEEFWSAYPNCKRKGSKTRCLERWTRNGLDGVADLIIPHVRAMAGTTDWQKDDHQYVPAPLAYLNQSKWDGAETDAFGSAINQMDF